MHSFHGKTANFHFNGDFSGEVHIMPKDQKGDILLDSNGEYVEVEIDAEDLLKFIAYHYILSEAIGNLESMDYLELLSVLQTKAKGRS